MMRLRFGRQPEDWMETGVVLGGAVDGMCLPYDLNDEETTAEQHALVDALNRKRPAGFAPWPEGVK